MNFGKIIAKFSVKRSQAGVSLVETLVVSFFSALLTYFLYGLFTSTIWQSGKFSDLTDEVNENIAADRQILADFRNAAPSFNGLELMDDYGENFFDLLRDVPKGMIDPLPESEKTRTFTLGVDPSKNEDRIFVLLLARDQAAVYNPVDAYNTSAPPAVTFENVNFNNTITDSTTGLFPGAWRVGATFLFYSPVDLRATANPLEPGKWLQYLGVVGASDLLSWTDELVLKNPPNTYRTGPVTVTPPTPPATLPTVAYSRTNPVFRHTHPVSGVNIATPDDFFMNLPSVAAGSAPAYLVPVTLVRYRVRTLVWDTVGNKPATADKDDFNSKFRGRSYHNLIRERWLNGAFETQGQLIIEDLERVVLKRSSVTVPSLSISIKRPDAP